MGSKRHPKGNLARELADELSAAKAEIAVLTRIIENLIEKSAGNPPDKLVKSLLEGLAPLFLGYRDQNRESKAKVSDLAGLMAGLDDTAGVERGIWFPDVEFDESMEPREKWPEPGTISGISGTPSSASSGASSPTYKMTPNGAERADGQEMFQAGATGPPPASATE